MPPAPRKIHLADEEEEKSGFQLSRRHLVAEGGAAATTLSNVLGEI